MYEFKCHKCGYVFHEKLRYCPNCGTVIKYAEKDWQAKNNYNDNHFAKVTNGIGNAGDSMMQFGCGCMVLIIFIIIIIAII
ncbi:hypothetical protein DY124_06350 [Apilactobacillus micheneri]|uniref:hypothetical protein n=1 Tax=Apilactobacillus micheneri TaxID=1899430 RepID=UPI00112A4E22|nr:hypothetical protein [Apilactobacillus micheneri]TPR43194.1 hypothetical protein DY124_06350 [Apilactobacillus micheneri]TPR47031.1 hypothetical protein DY125_07710 [Apilactobacillus micheneri]